MPVLAAVAALHPVALPDSAETGALGVRHLKRYWARMQAARQGAPPPHEPGDRQRDTLIVHGLGIGLEQVMRYLGDEAPDFAKFERWILTTAGGLPPERIARLNAALADEVPPAATRQWLATIDALPPVLSDDDLAHWREHGYVVVHDAVPDDTRDAAAQALWDHLGARADDADSWYVDNDHGIMVQIFQHPAFEANRRAPRLQKAFAQLHGTSDLWATTDRVGFNVPERPGFTFRGPDLHWDVSLKQPIPFGTQGILYLTDTPPEQGAFTLVPGFHRWGGDWLASLPPGTDARTQNLHALGSKAIGGRAGDLIIWHHALPHGASPNRGIRRGWCSTSTCSPPTSPSRKSGSRRRVWFRAAAYRTRSARRAARLRW
ncbi:MAG TPA: phytanoyl-CoA dioxygenase family protein [Pseudolabrys sp.]|nr:phytanoyl-CoA dioxygenase family protein [Pseudolabrys sp.]